MTIVDRYPDQAHRFSSVTADSNADQALLTTGKAAMMVHGTWTYGSMAGEGGDFASGGHLGYMTSGRSTAARATPATCPS
ncbi:hypothetical protein [Phytohabitans houttuyneae]|uniref:Uncharacterized protein n=1 Tax=Phytohabitans houttuyneae TaxID=1076126 RepID=A0A6V8K5D8_9ACTN|nr:hypothetical protein [Phytohabitans houttuyneae]GFJ76015.1 hypothetical protein Phou_001950 [Phytohabitans houttuyneae]